MKVHVLGSSGTYPVPGRPASGFVVEHGTTRVWCDAGPGTFLSLPFESDLIDAIVVSHQHPDHCSDLLTAFHSWTYRPNPRNGVPLFAPAPVWERLVAFVGSSEKLEQAFAFRPVDDGQQVEVGTLAIEFVAMEHSVPALGSRWLGGGRSLFYTGDTGPQGEWSGRLGGVDVMLAEASYQDATRDPNYPMHMSAREAGEIARRLGVGRLVLTHIPPHLDATRSVHEAEQAFDRPVALATPGAWFSV